MHLGAASRPAAFMVGQAFQGGACIGLMALKLGGMQATSSLGRSGESETQFDFLPDWGININAADPPFSSIHRGDSHTVNQDEG